MTIYRRLLRIAAPHLAREYGEAMEEMLATRLREAGGWRCMSILCNETRTLAAIAVSERLGPRARAHRRQRRAHARGKAGGMDTIGQELRQAARRLLHSPAFTATTVLTLALAIGANAAIFAVVERVVINPLPYPQSDRLIELDHGSVSLKVAAGLGNTSGLYLGEVYPPGTLPPLSLFRAVGGAYFETMGMRILRGRGIERGDVDRKEPVAVISRALATNAFKDADPIGRRIASNQLPAPDGTRRLEWLTVVGVVSDTPTRALTEPSPMPMTFIPMSVANGSDMTRILPSAALMRFVVRVQDTPLSIVPAIRHSVRSVDADLAVAQVTTLQAMVDGASAQLSFTMVLLAIAAGVALILGVIGIYGVTAYIVTQRTSEIGVRLALGADPHDIIMQLVKQGGVVASIGIVIGLAGAFAGGQLISSVLYGVSARDPLVFVATALTLQAIALIACWAPARRASRLDATLALRAE